MTDADDYAALIAAELLELERGRLDDEDYEDAFAALDAWTETCLVDFDATASLMSGRVASVSIARTLGGPSCWIDCCGDGTVRITTRWGSDESSMSLHAPTLDAWAWERAEMMLADPPADRYRQQHAPGPRVGGTRVMARWEHGRMWERLTRGGEDTNMRTVVMYLDDGGEDTLSIEYTRDTGGVFVRLRHDGTDLASYYAVPWRDLETFARELLAVSTELDASRRCSAPIECGERMLPTVDACYRHGGRP